jgi:hypothetical protein
VAPIYEAYRDELALGRCLLTVTDLLLADDKNGEAGNILRGQVIPALTQVGDLRGLAMAAVRDGFLLGSEGHLDQGIHRIERESIAPLMANQDAGPLAEARQFLGLLLIRNASPCHVLTPRRDHVLVVG